MAAMAMAEHFSEGEIVEVEMRILPMQPVEDWS
jgi:hypothetical protein